MKLMWSTYSVHRAADDFREKHPSVWVDIDSSLSTPGACITCRMTSWTSCEVAAEREFDAGSRQRAPLERLRADADAQPDRAVAGAVTPRHRAIRPSAIRWPSTTRRPVSRKRIRDDRRASRAAGGSPASRSARRWTPPRLRREPVDAARALSRGARPSWAWWIDQRRCLQRPLQPQRLRNIWRRPVQTPAPPIWGSRRWLDRDLAVVRRNGLHVDRYLSYYGTRPARRRWTGFLGTRWRRRKDWRPDRAVFAQSSASPRAAQGGVRLDREPAEYFIAAA